MNDAHTPCVFEAANDIKPLLCMLENRHHISLNGLASSFLKAVFCYFQDLVSALMSRFSQLSFTHCNDKGPVSCKMHSF